jgi:hypothetical protein
MLLASAPLPVFLLPAGELVASPLNCAFNEMPVRYSFVKDQKDCVFRNLQYMAIFAKRSHLLKVACLFDGGPG